jgi:hypothetical protein
MRQKAAIKIEQLSCETYMPLCNKTKLLLLVVVMMGRVEKRVLTTDPRTTLERDVAGSLSPAQKGS